MAKTFCRASHWIKLSKFQGKWELNTDNLDGNFNLGLALRKNFDSPAKTNVDASRIHELNGLYWCLPREIQQQFHHTYEAQETIELRKATKNQIDYFQIHDKWNICLMCMRLFGIVKRVEPTQTRIQQDKKNVILKELNWLLFNEKL